jgi:hypothetical protein
LAREKIRAVKNIAIFNRSFMFNNSIIGVD